MSETFKAYRVKENNLKFTRSIENRSISELPKGDVLINVHYTSLNYKDVLSCTGNKTVTRHYPHTPGIDAAGVVVSSKVSHIKKNDKVIVTSFDLGANTDGGFGQFIRVPADWVFPLPEGLSLRESMIFGTAGFTAALSVSFMNDYLKGEKKRILVSGASGGVGSISVALLSFLGYEVVASTGKIKSIEFLKKIGAYEIIKREDIVDKLNRTLLKEQWSGAIDTVGGKTLENIIKSTSKRGIIVSAGMVSSPKLNISVYPFILRGIHLIGTGASEVNLKKRTQIWNLISNKWRLKILDDICTEINMNEIDAYIDNFINGSQIGRVIVNMKND